MSEKEMNLEMYYLVIVKENNKNFTLYFNYKFHNRIYYNVYITTF